MRLSTTYLFSLLILLQLSKSARIKSLMRQNLEIDQRAANTLEQQSKSQTDSRMRSAASQQAKQKIKSGTVAGSAASADQEESLSSLMEQYAQAGVSAAGPQKPSQISEEEAMYAFSQAKLNGVKIMDLPDAPKQQQNMDEEQEIALFQANELEKQSQEEQKKNQVAADELQEQSFEQQVVQLATQLSGEQALQSAPEAKPKEEAPNETQNNAQAALDEVEIQIPDGMQVKSHMAADASSDESGQSSTRLKKQDGPAAQDKFPGEAKDQDPISMAQSALEPITVKDTTKEKPAPKPAPPPKLVDSLFDKNLREQQDNSTIKQEQVFQPLFEPPQELPKAPERTPESEESIRKSQAASEFVAVKQVNNSPSTNQNAGGGRDAEPIYPQYLKETKHIQKPAVQPSGEADQQIQITETDQAEGGQASKEPQEQQEEQKEQQMEKHITGSEGMWDSQLEMEHITGKLTRPADYRPKEVMEAERKSREKIEKQKIRDELLQPDPVTDFDTRLYSDQLATQSSKSKSANEIAQDKEQASRERQHSAEAARKQLEEIQQQNKLYQEQLDKEENAQIAQAQSFRVQKKNQEDMQNMEDLKALEKLQRGNSNTQVQSMTEMAELEEKDKSDGLQMQYDMKQAKEQIQRRVQDQASSQEDAQSEMSSKAYEFSEKLGVKVEAADLKLPTKEAIAQTMIQRAIQAGKTEQQITEALTG